MRLKNIVFISLLLLAVTFGRHQKVVLPFWGWFIWGALFSISLMGWFVISRAVAWTIRKAVLCVPISTRLEERAGKLSIPVEEIHTSTTRIESEIAAKIKFRPLAWLAVKAFRSKTDEFIGSILNHCKANDSTVFDERLFATWLHQKVADAIATTAAEIASSIWMVIVILLAAFGLYFATGQFQ